MSNPELVTPLDLDQWSDSLAAQTTLPILVRRLIFATAPVTEITMRAREGALLPGWDGIVRSDATDPHVPLGTSGWELGTSKDPRDKAQSDIRQRTEKPLGLDPKTTTFVAATSRIWRDRDDWRDDRRKERKWADIRAYDADDLVTWLERAPSVHYWISEQLGREPRDVRTPDMFRPWPRSGRDRRPPALVEPPVVHLLQRGGSAGIAVEVGVRCRDPRTAPAHPPLARLKRGQRSLGNKQQGHVAGMQVRRQDVC